MRGRKPDPTPLKILSGSRPDRVNASEPALPASRPEPPDYLDEVAAAKWLELVETAEAMGTLTQAEGEAIVIYAQAFSRKRSAEKDIAVGGVTTTCGTGGLKPHPALGVIRDAEATMMRLLSEFGFTPASRSKVQARQEGPKDALGEFLNRRKKG
jgi:P27 family predicted phage terminase small subunit